MSDLIDKQQAIEAICMETCGVSLRNERCMVHCTEVQAVEKLPPAQPQIIYCKDCAKHNKRLGDYEIRLLDGKTKWIGTDKACPLVAIRGKAQGHEFDYQFCTFAERRTDG